LRACLSQPLKQQQEIEYCCRSCCKKHRNQGKLGPRRREYHTVFDSLEIENTIAVSSEGRAAAGMSMMTQISNTVSAVSRHYNAIQMFLNETCLDNPLDC